MPTPFTHLETAQRLLRDPQVPAAARALLEAERSAFLLGQIAADARVNSGLLRTDTHFYHYDQPIIQHPWRVMLERHPALLQAETAAQRAFLAGYVAHLCVDEVWLMEMLKPHFGDRDWAPQPTRFFILHIL
ncbi:MAG: zinc dependent phospholipase C family protein, partial [Anaerolineae bacterium]|nr:zinc dependent phospholipase C family protein [Anaerolineae bacterium]